MSIVHSSIPSFELPEGPHEIIDNLLISADELNAENAITVKYYVESYPDLFVRLIPQEPVKPAMMAGDRLGEYGVIVLPYHIVEHDGEEWVITKRVTGLGLEEALARDGDQRLLRAVDENWAGLTAHLMAAKRDGLSVPSDIEGPHQYMFGSIDFESTGRSIYLVDLPWFVMPIDSDPINADNYAEELLSIASGVIDTELAASSRLGLAREMIGLAMEEIDTSSQWSRQLGIATKFVLNNCEGLDHIVDKAYIMELAEG
jgi:hypothetical protein